MGLHDTRGSPVKPNGQVQIIAWLIILQSALYPQLPGHGSLHFWFIHDKSLRHSELLTHSGRQFGGAPM